MNELRATISDDSRVPAVLLQWCPPCRGFTPVLSKFFDTHGAAKKLKLIFVSSDSSMGEFQEYFHEMSWNLALPPGAAADRLKRTFAVRGIPMLVLLDSEGNILTKEARMQLMQDPAGKGFPWASGGPKGRLAAPAAPADECAEGSGAQAGGVTKRAGAAGPAAKTMSAEQREAEVKRMVAEAQAAATSGGGSTVVTLLILAAVVYAALKLLA